MLTRAPLKVPNLRSRRDLAAEAIRFSLASVLWACASAMLCLSIGVAASAQDGDDEVAGDEAAAAAGDNAEDGGAPVRAADPAFVGPQAAQIKLPLPIARRNVWRAEWKIRQVVAALREKLPEGGAGRVPLILEFAASPDGGGGSSFTASYDLAKYITNESIIPRDFKTVAFVPRSVSGHAILPIMACEEVVMAADAEIGRAAGESIDGGSVSDTIVTAYREIAGKRRTFPVEIALGMLDKDFEVLQVQTEDGPEIVFRRDLEALLRRTSELPNSQRKVIIERGDTGWFTGSQARSLGFVQYLADDPSQLYRALDVEARRVMKGAIATQEVNPRMLTVRGYINAKISGSRRRMIENCQREGVNYICFWIEASGGDVGATLELASAIAVLKSDQIRTVAYVPQDAQGMGALLALSCDELVLRPASRLGGGDQELTEDELEDVTYHFQDLAEMKQRRWSLPLAMFDPALAVHAYRDRRSNRLAYFAPDELKTQDDPDNWQRQQAVNVEGELLEVDGLRAVELGLAGDTVDSFDEFKAREQLASEVELAEPGWTEELIEILATPQVASLLLVIGLVGMYAEVQMPGIGVGGFVATVAFVVFFWANYMEQTANTLEILLFLVGVGCLVLEVFVLPGFGIFGLGGGLLIITSLVLASQTFVLPGTDAEIRQLRDSLLVVGSSGVGFVALAVLMRRYLPHTPMFRHILLEPPGAEHPEEQDVRETMIDLRHLRGAQGVAATQLTPSGKVRFGSDLVDVVTDGELIEKGATVTVAEVHGTRVVVRSSG
ncbi:MAG: hypothetical protein DWQ31_21715 [Planctomycetota bacterium]|nr:MAG: hypothetical protein DWQ31_21715 [Planctomycetota bacterium]REJ93719.1 MAG: hypothetical protein DWQ35_10250 [Planctomycetota bacterium]REK25767.1 MAG: hypothetical protein DWQ42_10985 [Planctomycetota bacterium]REK46485.1 MAG: hypothetical protein DWQ46_06320 [Planctomycetota bacterium]